MALVQVSSARDGRGGGAAASLQAPHRSWSTEKEERRALQRQRLDNDRRYGGGGWRWEGTGWRGRGAHQLAVLARVRKRLSISQQIKPGMGAGFWAGLWCARAARRGGKHRPPAKQRQRFVPFLVYAPSRKSYERPSPLQGTGGMRPRPTDQGCMPARGGWRVQEGRGPAALHAAGQ